MKKIFPESDHQGLERKPMKQTSSESNRANCNEENQNISR
jgi:hypothetical protein